METRLESSAQPPFDVARVDVLLGEGVIPDARELVLEVQCVLRSSSGDLQVRARDGERAVEVVSEEDDAIDLVDAHGRERGVGANLQVALGRLRELSNDPLQEV